MTFKSIFKRLVNKLKSPFVELKRRVREPVAQPIPTYRLIVIRLKPRIIVDLEIPVYKRVEQFEKTIDQYKQQYTQQIVKERPLKRLGPQIQEIMRNLLPKPLSIAMERPTKKLSPKIAALVAIYEPRHLEMAEFYSWAAALDIGKEENEKEENEKDPMILCQRRTFERCCSLDAFEAVHQGKLFSASCPELALITA
jgi:hypothetical protein